MVACPLEGLVGEWHLLQELGFRRINIVDLMKTIHRERQSCQVSLATQFTSKNHLAVLNAPGYCLWILRRERKTLY